MLAMLLSAWAAGVVSVQNVVKVRVSGIAQGCATSTVVHGQHIKLKVYREIIHESSCYVQVLVKFACLTPIKYCM